MADGWPWASYSSSSPPHSVTRGHLPASPFFCLWWSVLLPVLLTRAPLLFPVCGWG